MRPDEPSREAEGHRIGFAPARLVDGDQRRRELRRPVASSRQGYRKAGRDASRSGASGASLGALLAFPEALLAIGQALQKLTKGLCQLTGRGVAILGLPGHGLEADGLQLLGDRTADRRGGRGGNV